MRTDLTLRDNRGNERDVAVYAPAGTTFDAVAEPLSRLGAEPAWGGVKRLRPDAVLGRGALATGAVLTPDRRGDADLGAPGARLQIVGGPGAGRGIAIKRPTLTVGRDSSCDLVLPDPQSSRRHLVLDMTGAVAAVRDLGSTHGTLVDGERIAGEHVLASGSLIRVGDTFLAVTTAAEQGTSVQDGPAGTAVINRPPRTRTQPDDRAITRPAPPSTDRAPRIAWIAALLPALTGALLAALLHSVLLLAFSALTPVALLGGSVGDRLRWRRGQRRAATTHRSSVSRVDDEIAAAIRAELLARRAADPDPCALRRIASLPTARLWERRRGDDDLLRVRVGLASLPSSLRLDDAGTIRSAAALAAVPHTVDLGRGPLGIAAPAPIRDGLARWIVTQIAVLTSPADVEIALLLSDENSWRWARWLPHVKGRVASTPAQREALVDDLTELVRGRCDVRDPQGDWAGTRLVVIVDRTNVAPRLAGLLADGCPLGLTALCLDDRTHALPAACAQVVRVAGDAGSTVEVGTVRVVADQVDVDWADRVARALAPMHAAEAHRSASVPTECRLADLLSARPGSVADVHELWRGSDGSARAIVGLSEDGPVVIDLDRDGPHVLIAGTTGAGKSELLQSLVTGLAVAHPPSALTFLLVDYKGGAAFAECADLPHTVGLVTDLDARLTERVLASLNSEIRRRETLLAAAGARDVVAYRARGAELARLVLVVDEFAALAEELAELVPGLVGIARRGRSLGLHLVLATQRPAGVVSPEIRANLALRIAFRVTSTSESTDIIDGPEAAAIDRHTPGRAYLRVGTTTVGFQAARVTAAAPAPPTGEVRVTLLDNWRRIPREPASTGDTDLSRYVHAVRAAAANMEPPRRPWLPPLPRRLTLADLPVTSSPRQSVPIGLLDLPAEQRQEPLTVDLRTGGTMLLVGGARSGRTTALLSLALAAADRCSPEELHIHVVDGAGTGLQVLAALPHLGTAVAGEDCTDLVGRLVQRLRQEFGRRLGGAGRLPVLLLLVDGWEALLAASEEFDGGRTVERLLALLRDAPAAGATIAITGGRGALAPRLAAQAPTRLVLPLHDPGDYAQAGIHARSVPGTPSAGRGIRVADGAEFQIAQAAATPSDFVQAVATRWPDVPSARIRVRALPAQVHLAELTPQPGRCLLGVGGDEAAPISFDPRAGTTRLLVAGPARSGRTTLLCSVLSQLCSMPSQRAATGILVAAGARSRLAVAARGMGLPVLCPGDRAPDLGGDGLLLVDDVDAFADTDVGAALSDWVRADRAGRFAVVAGRSDALAVAFRGLAAEIRQSRCGVLLQPGPADGELLGVSLPRARASAVPGRGVLVPDPAWGLGGSPVPVQVALP